MSLFNTKTVNFILLLIIFMPVLDRGIRAQEPDQMRTDLDPAIPNYLCLETNFNDEDFLLGLGFLHRCLSQIDLRVFICSFWLRPYGKAVLSKYTENIYFIFKEELYALLLGLDKEFIISRDLSLFSSAGLGLVYKNYRGSNRDNLEVIVPILTAGLGYGFAYNADKNRNQFLLRLGYQYYKMSIFPHRFYLALGLIL